MPKRAALTLALLASVCLPPTLAKAQEAPAVAPARAPDLVTLMAEMAPIAAKHRQVKDFPALTPAELRRAESGNLVVKETPVAGANVPRLTIATVMPYPVEALYLVLGDLQAQQDYIPQLDHSVVISQQQKGMVREAFQYMGQPYPAQDRGWITRMENNRALFEASGGRYWELPWSMQTEKYKTFLESADSGSKLPRSLSMDDLHSATTPNYGTGAWILVPLGDNRTYVQYDGFTDPNPNSIKKGFASALGTKLQTGMFNALEPLAQAYTNGKKKSTNVLVDMQGHSTNGLLDRLKQLWISAEASGR